MPEIQLAARRSGPPVSGKKLRVNGVAPGPIWPPLQVSGGIPEGRLEHFGADTPDGQAGAAGGARRQVYGAVGGRGGP
jgi:hypothetical protein